jgi:hypothetical protein
LEAKPGLAYLRSVLNSSGFRPGLFGYNVFDNLYITEGSYAAVTDNPNDIPPYEEVVGQVDVSFRRVGTAMAVDDLGAVVGRLPGTTVSGSVLSCYPYSPCL